MSLYPVGLGLCSSPVVVFLELNQDNLKTPHKDVSLKPLFWAYYRDESSGLAYQCQRLSSLQVVNPIATNVNIMCDRPHKPQDSTNIRSDVIEIFT